LQRLKPKRNQQRKLKRGTLSRRLTCAIRATQIKPAGIAGYGEILRSVHSCNGHKISAAASHGRSTLGETRLL
jgi:hypothetical protein